MERKLGSMADSSLALATAGSLAFGSSLGVLSILDGSVPNSSSRPANAGWVLMMAIVDAEMVPKMDLLFIKLLLLEAALS